MQATEALISERERKQTTRMLFWAHETRSMDLSPSPRAAFVRCGMRFETRRDVGRAWDRAAVHRKRLRRGFDSRARGEFASVRRGLGPVVTQLPLHARNGFHRCCAQQARRAVRLALDGYRGCKKRDVSGAASL